MKSADWLLLTINDAKETGLTPVQLQKSLFLISKPLNLKKFYDFIPYSYGPFDSKIYLDAETLADQGLLSINYNGLSYPHYQVSPTGAKKASDIKKKMNKNEVDFVQKTIDFVKSLSFKELLKTVYESYPEYAVNSIFKEKI